MHKSVRVSSEEGTQRAQKVDVGDFCCSVEYGPAGGFWDTSVCFISFFPRGGQEHLFQGQIVFCILSNQDCFE